MSNPAVMMYVPFALNGQKRDIPVTNPSTANPQDASYNTGFPDITMTANVGEPPNGQDFNGIFYAITTDLIHRQSGKQIQFDATYASNIGGYAKGSIVQSTDLTKSYISTADGNTTDPDSSSSKNWNVYSQPPLATSTTVGTVKLADTLNSTAKDTALTANQGNVLASMMKGGNNHQWIGGTLIQWGTTTASNGDMVNFENPFPNNLLNVSITDANGYSNNGYEKKSSTVSAFKLLTSATYAINFSYIAIGN